MILIIIAILLVVFIAPSETPLIQAIRGKGEVVKIEVSFMRVRPWCHVSSFVNRRQR